MIELQSQYGLLRCDQTEYELEVSNNGMRYEHCSFH